MRGITFFFFPRCLTPGHRAICSCGRINTVPILPPPSLAVASTTLTAAAVSAPSLPPRLWQRWQHHHCCLVRSNNCRRIVTTPQLWHGGLFFFWCVHSAHHCRLLASLPAPSWPLRHCNHGPTQELCQHPHCHCGHINTLDPRCCRSTSALTTTTPASAPLQRVAPSPSPRLWHRHQRCHVRDSTLTATGAAATPLPSLQAHNHGSTHIAAKHMTLTSPDSSTR